MIDFQTYVAAMPELHSWDGGKTWNTGGYNRELFQSLRAFFDRKLTGRVRIIETGCGNSTIFFLLAEPERVVTIDPDSAVYQRVIDYCAAQEIPTVVHEMNIGPSEIVLPKIAELGEKQFEFALIDGDHSWPSAFVDFCYFNMLVGRGGYIMIDDVQLHSCKELARFVSEEPGFALSLDLGKALVFEKLTDEKFPRGWGEQPYIARLSKSYEAWPEPTALYTE